MIGVGVECVRVIVPVIVMVVVMMMMGPRVGVIVMVVIGHTIKCSLDREYSTSLKH